MLRKASLMTALLVAFSGCNQLEDVSTNTEAKNASAIAEFYDFSWKGYVEADNCYRPHVAIDAQILYTVGQLNGVNSVGRLDQIKISDIATEEMADGCAITYQATMPVAWGYEEKASETYTFLLPRNLGQGAIDQFVERYTADCLTWGAHDVDDGVFWYYYRPKNSACKLDPNDVIELVAELGPNEQATEGKYPEYDKVWEDDVLNVVAIFGKAVEESTGYDGGISAFGKFRRLVEQELGDAVTFAETVGEREGAVTTIKAELDDGKRVNVHVFMIRSVSAAGDAFWTAYESLTPTADYIVYNGHSGLGQNVRKLARRGEWQTGQYAIVFMNGCDTFAYIDSALADAHAAVNEDDPDGTKYLDVVANAMPSYVSSTPSATMAILIGLLSYDAPMTYEEILSLIDPREVALVTGEHDNTFEPDETF
ncbi:MAG: hypothetical protein ACON3Z_11120 [Bradymonadia bacterium]